MAKQKTKVFWLKKGVQNTKYFFKCIKGHQNVNFIQGVMLKDGSYSHEMDKVKKKFVNHFKRVFNGNSYCNVEIEELKKLVKFSISYEKALSLSKDVKDKKREKYYFLHEYQQGSRSR